MKRWQIRGTNGQPIDFINAVTAAGAVIIARNKRCQQDTYYDFLWEIKEIDGCDIRLK